MVHLRGESHFKKLKKAYFFVLGVFLYFARGNVCKSPEKFILGFLINFSLFSLHLQFLLHLLPLAWNVSHHLPTAFNTPGESNHSIQVNISAQLHHLKLLANIKSIKDVTHTMVHVFIYNLLNIFTRMWLV